MANVIEVVIRAKDEASNQIRQVEQALGAAEGSFAKFALAGAAVAAGLAVAGASINAFVQNVRQGADIGDALNKTAQQTGLAVEEISRLKFAAEQSNTSIESLNVGLRFLSKNLFEAQRGGAEQIATLRELGFTGQEAAGNLGGTSEALLKIADRLRAVEDPGTRTALAMRVFGRSAQDIVPLLNVGSEGIRALGAEADRLGITVSTAAGVLGDEFNDAVSKVRSQMDGLKTKLAEAALPAFTAAVNVASEALAKMGQVVAENREAFEFIAGFIGKSVEFGINITVAGVEALQAAVKLLEPFQDLAKNAERRANEVLRSQQAIKTGRTINGATEFSQEIPTLPEDVVTASRPSKRPRVLTDADKKAIEDAKKAMEAFNRVVADSYLVSEGLGASLLKTLGAEKAAGLIAALQAVEDAAIRADTSLRGLKPPQTQTESVKRLIDNAPGELPTLELVPPDQDSRLASALQYLDDIGASVENINDALATQGETWATITIGFEAFGAALKDALDPARNLIADMSDAAYQFSESFTASFGTLFEDLIVKGQRFRDAFASFMLGIARAVGALVKDIAAAIAKALILRALTGGLFSGGGTVVQSIAGAAQGGTVRLAQGGSVIASAVSRVAAPIARLAAGGSAAFSAPLKLAGGAINIIPGNPQAFDRIPALLSPGEAVLPTVGGRSPGPLLSGLESLGKDLAGLLARMSAIGGGESGGRGGDTYHVNLSAIEADGFRGYMRTGAFGREFALASDPARD